MLSFFRRGGAGQIIIGAVVFAVIIVFVMEFRPGRQGGKGITRDCAVKLLDSCVDKKEYWAAYGLTVPRGLPQKKVRSMGLKKAVMEGLVERELLLKEADRLGVSVSEEELDEELAAGRARVSIPMAQVGYLGYSLGLSEDLVRVLPVKSTQTEEFDYKIYERVVRNTTNRSPKEFKEMQRREMIAQRMRDLVKARVRVSETEAFTAWERDRSKAVARVAEIKREWFAKWIVDATDAAVDAWIAKNEKQVEEAWKPTQVTWKAECPLVSEIMVNVEEEASDTDKTDKRKKIDTALERVKKGEAFGFVARTDSEGVSAALGGELGCLNESYGPGAKELTDAVKDLKPGQLTSVIETKRGFHVLKLEGKLAEKDLEKIGKRTVARRLAAQQMASELAKEFADKLIERVKAGDKLDDATKELVTQYASKAIAAQKAKKPAAAPAAPGAAPAAKPAQPKAADDSPVLSDPNKPKVEITAPFTIGSSPIEDALPTEASAAKVFQLEKPDAVVEKALLTQSGFAVIQLKEKNLAKKDDFTKDRLSVLRSLRSAKEQDAITRYVASLRTKVKDKITFDQKLLEEGTTDDSGDG